MVEDVESATGGSGDGLFGRHMAPLTPSVDSSLNNQEFAEKFSKEVQTDDECQDFFLSQTPYPSSSAHDSNNEKSARRLQDIALDCSGHQEEEHHEDDDSADADVDDDEDVNVDDDENSLDRETVEHVTRCSTLRNDESIAEALPEESNEHFLRRLQRYQKLLGGITEEAKDYEENELNDTDYVDQKDISPLTAAKHMSEPTLTKEHFEGNISKNDTFTSSTEPIKTFLNVQVEEKRDHILEKS